MKNSICEKFLFKILYFWDTLHLRFHTSYIWTSIHLTLQIWEISYICDSIQLRFHTCDILYILCEMSMYSYFNNLATRVGSSYTLSHFSVILHLKSCIRIEKSCSKVMGLKIRNIVSLNFKYKMQFISKSLN